MSGSGFLKILVVYFLLLCLSFELSNHNRQRAAVMPIMVGMMVRVVVMMNSTEAHKFPAYLLILSNWTYT